MNLTNRDIAKNNLKFQIKKTRILNNISLNNLLRILMETKRMLN